MLDRAALLHAAVVPDAEHSPVGADEGRTDRDASLADADPRLVDGQRQELLIVHERVSFDRWSVMRVVATRVCRGLGVCRE